jgi:hypothetical protein
MKHSSDGRRQQGTIRMLLKNCLTLLVKEKYPQVISVVVLFLFHFTVLKEAIHAEFWSGNILGSVLQKLH